MSDIIIIITYTLAVLFFFAFTRVLTTTIHELGHYIAGSVFLKGDYTIFIGSYGDPSKGFLFKIGNLKVHFKYNPILWQYGLCVPNKTNNSILGNYLFILAGPIASLLTTFFCFYILILTELHGLIKFGTTLLLLSSITDFFYNILPHKTPIKLHNGEFTYNDGQSLKNLSKYKKTYSHYLKIYEYYNKSEFDKAIATFESIYPTSTDPHLIRMGIAAYISNENYSKAIDLLIILKSLEELNSDDLSNYGLAYSLLGEHNIALEFYNQSLQLNPDNFNSLNNRGYTYNLIENYTEAIADFDRAIKLNIDFAYAYNNRGLAHIKLGNLEGGLKDIDKSMEIDQNNSYAYKNLGIYYFDIGNYEKAKELFLIAKELNKKTHGLPEQLEAVSKRLSV